MSRSWSDEDISFLLENYTSSSISAICCHLERSQQSVYNKSSNLGITSEKTWSEDELGVIAAYPYLSTQQLVDLLPGRSHAAVDLKRQRYGKIIGLPKRQESYNVDDNYFASPNLESAYWAGFIAADGNIFGNKIKIELQNRDHTHLVSFKECIKFTGKVSTFCRKSITGKMFDYSKINFASSTMVSDLNVHYNITRDKTLTLQKPNIGEFSLLQAYIVGFIDGDGSIGYYYRKGRNRSWWSLKLSGNIHMMIFIKDFFDANYPANNMAKVLPRKVSTVNFNYGVAGKRAETILGELSRIEVPRLRRKWNKFILDN